MAKSGFQRRKERVARGLPRYTAAEAESRKKRDAARTRLARRRLVTQIAQYKVDQGCADCGYRDHAVALDFDHLPGEEKHMNVSRVVLYKRNWEGVLGEIQKCEVVCSNCHRVRTARRQVETGGTSLLAQEYLNEPRRLRVNRPGA